MRHIDRHILELFVLGSGTVKARRRGIERHLDACPYCRAITKEIEELYSSADAFLATKRNASEIPSQAIVRREQDLLDQRIPIEISPLPEKRGPIQLFAWFVRRHPIIALSGSFATVAIIAFALGRSIPGASKDLELAAFHYDVGRGLIVAQNKASEVLWERSVYRLSDQVMSEELHRIQSTTILDLDQDGQKELITILPFRSDEGRPELDRLKIIDGSGALKLDRLLAHAVKWRGVEYPADEFGSGGLVVLNREPGAHEVVATIPAFRSPTMVVRLDETGRTLGEYWHHGHLPLIYRIGEGSQNEGRLILVGINDAEDNGVERSVVIVMLDPKELNGTTEASATKGYGYPPSRAELVYLRIPRNDMGRVLQQTPVIEYMLSADAGAVRFIVATSHESKEGMFEYVFSHDLRILDIRPIDGAAALHASLLKEERIKSEFNKGYFESLKRAIEYWDGHSWRKEYARVQHPIAAN